MSKQNLNQLVKGKNTKPEILLRKYLFSQGFHYRINVKGLVGTPDIVFRKYKTVIFVNGCFWHAHDKCNTFWKIQCALSPRAKSKLTPEKTL